MIVPNQFFKVKVTKKNIQHFRDLGYEVENLSIINVPLMHLAKGSHQMIKMICDCCGESYETEYRSLVRNNMFDKKHYCKKCSLSARLMEKYGVKHSMHLDWIVEKSNNTKINKYGSCYNEEMKKKQDQTKKEKYGEDYGKIAHEKAEQTCLERYGEKNPLKVVKFSEKAKQTTLDRYGYKNVSQIPEIKEKKRQTFLDRYGYETPFQVPEFIEKAKHTYAENGLVPTSSQQLKIYDMLKEYYKNYDIELNYPFRNFNFDIAILIPNTDIKIDIEYDGSYWHQDYQKDRRRDEVSKSYGWKILRIKSGHKIPTKEQLIKAIDKLINGYSYTEIKLDDWRDAA